MEDIKLKSMLFADKFAEYGGFALSGGYVFDEENKTQINACIEVFRKDERGLLLIGNPGSGKTLFFEMVQKIMHPQNSQAFIRISVLDVVLKFNAKEIGHGVFQQWKKHNVFFDDLGTEDSGHLFGEKVNVFEKFIQFRYDLFRSSKIKTHFTTNLSYDDLKIRYGARCVSRLNEMCDVIIVGGSANSTDRRNLRNFIGLPPVIHQPVQQAGGVDYEQYKKNQESVPPFEYEGPGSKLKKQFGDVSPTNQLK